MTNQTTLNDTEYNTTVIDPLHAQMIAARTAGDTAENIRLARELSALHTERAAVYAGNNAKGYKNNTLVQIHTKDATVYERIAKRLGGEI